MSFFYPSGLPVALSLVGYNALLTSLFILFKRRDRIGALYFISSLCTFVWAVGLSFMFNNNLAAMNAQVWGRVSQICFFLMPVSWLFFILNYTQTASAKKIQMAACLIFTAAFLGFSLTPWFILEFREIAGIKNYFVPGPAYNALTVIFLTVLIYSFWEFRDAMRSERTPLRRADFLFLFFTQLSGYSLCALSLLPAYGIPVPQYQFLLLPLWHFLLAYALVRHHLLDYEELAKAIHRDRLAAMAMLTASMHHELRNPLTAILTFSEYLPLKFEDPEFRQNFTSIIPEEVRRINRLLNQLLEFSRPLEPEVKAVDMREILNETLQFMQPQFEKGNVDAAVLFSRAPAVLADRDQIKQVFFNVIANSLQAMPLGGRLAVSSETDEKRKICRIIFKDDGQGIAKEQIENLFEPFFTTKAQGTGLGLFIVKQILSKQGGTIQVESAPGKGTTVKIGLRIAPPGKN